ncbi:hypothetical protein IFM89_011738 [Coptis chinensis]|uniref:Replication protein A subunit n=1 Tax=Coptis chinensis TaxID=261450 RepID=A0A835MEX6_9MAGN|nr:hypothetical protein IFM89_011738 [Coptis chinensis]
MEKTITPNAISTIMANPSPDTSSSPLPDLVVQVLELKSIGQKSRYTFEASDGEMKLKAMSQSSLSSEITMGNLQNLGLIRILDYTLNPIPNKTEKYLIVLKFEIVSQVLEMEIKGEAKKEDNNNNTGIVLRPKVDVGVQLKRKQEMVAKSAAQIMHEQHGNSALSARMGLTRRVYPLNTLNPYNGTWTIKVRVTSKGNMRSYKNARGEGHVFNVELTDEEGTQIQATMFNAAAQKFYDKFEMGKVYYISKGTLKLANKQFKTVQNDYEMTLNEYSEVEEVTGEEIFVPETKFNFVQIDQLSSYVNGRELVDVIGVVQNVSPTMSIRRKLNNEIVPKRDITIADDSKKTVVVSLWNDHATNIGQELLDTVDSAPIVAIKSLKVGDFQGVSLSSLSKSTLLVNPDVPESKRLRTWYNSEGKETTMDSVGSGMVSNTSWKGVKSMYSDRVCVSHITSNLSLGDDKPVFCMKACISNIKPDQTMWYQACKVCNKKVTDGIGSGYWCGGCQKNVEEFSLRYILVVRIFDPSGGAYVSVFNEQAEKIIGCSADELDKMKKDGDETSYLLKLKEATWAPHVFCVVVTQADYNNEKRQRITVRDLAPVDFVAESRFLLEEISKMQDS